MMAGRCPQPTISQTQGCRARCLQPHPLPQATPASCVLPRLRRAPLQACCRAGATEEGESVWIPSASVRCKQAEPMTTQTAQPAAAPAQQHVGGQRGARLGQPVDHVSAAVRGRGRAIHTRAILRLGRVTTSMPSCHFAAGAESATRCPTCFIAPILQHPSAPHLSQLTGGWRPARPAPPEPQAPGCRRRRQTWR